MGPLAKCKQRRWRRTLLRAEHVHVDVTEQPRLPDVLQCIDVGDVELSQRAIDVQAAVRADNHHHDDDNDNDSGHHDDKLDLDHNQLERDDNDLEPDDHDDHVEPNHDDDVEPDHHDDDHGIDHHDLTQLVANA